MSSVSITYNEAQKCFPSVVGIILQNIKNSPKAKANQVTPDKYKWSIDWSTMAVCMSPASVFTEMGKVKKRKTVQEYMDDVLGRSKFFLTATYKRSWNIELKSVPQQIIDQLTPIYQKQVEEEKRIDALTPEQRNAEVNKLLGELGKDPSFTAIGIKI